MRPIARNGILMLGIAIALIAARPETALTSACRRIGAIESFKTIPMYSSAESHKARDVYKKVKGSYAPPSN